jgi:hypothetical protein
LHCFALGLLRFFISHCGNKPITTPRHRLNIARLTAIVPQRFSEHEDALRQVRLFDKSVGPNLLQQLVLLDELTGVQNQPDEYLGGFWPERNYFTGTSKQTII